MSGKRNDHVFTEQNYFGKKGLQLINSLEEVSIKPKKDGKYDAWGLYLFPSERYEEIDAKVS